MTRRRAPRPVVGARGRMRFALVEPARAVRRSVRDPAVVRVQLAWAAVMTASWGTTVTLSVVAYAAGGSAAVAYALLARSAPGAVLGPVVGGLVDRWPGRSMAGAAAVGALSCAGAAAADGSVLAVVALMSVVALAAMVFRASQSAVMPEIVEEPADLTAANVLSSAVEAVGAFVGPALAGVLIAWRSTSLASAVAAALFCAAGVLLVRLGVGDHRRRKTADAGVPPSMRELLRVPAARLLLLLIFAQTLVAGALVVLCVPLAVDVLDVGLGSVGLLRSAPGLGGVVGALALFALAASSRLGSFTAAALLLWSLPLLLVPVAPALVPVLVLLVVVGVGNATFDVTCVTLLQRAVPSHLRGRAFGALETVVVVGLGLGAVVAPLLERALGPRWAFVGLGLPLLLVAAAGLRPLQRLDRSLAPPGHQVALLRGLAPFALLPSPTLEGIALRLRRQECPAGVEVTRQGEPGRTYVVIESGTLDVGVDGRDVSRLGPGDAFGEIALLHGGVRTATVRTRTPAVLWSLDGALFLAALQADGGRALAAADRVSQEHLRRAAPKVAAED